MSIFQTATLAQGFESLAESASEDRIYMMGLGVDPQFTTHLLREEIDYRVAAYLTRKNFCPVNQVKYSTKGN